MKHCLFFCIACLISSTISAQPWGQVHRTNASDIELSGDFGHSVDISGRYAFVGGYYSDAIINGQEAINAGAVYVFEQSASGRWLEVQKLESDYPDEWDFFGRSVAVHGDHAIVGASSEDTINIGPGYNGGAGAAYIFQRDANGQWNRTAKLRSFDAKDGDSFGWSVAINDRYAVIGAVGEDEDENGEWLSGGFDAGSVYIYEKVGNDWVFQQKIIAADKGLGHDFGNDVALTRDQIIVGAPLETRGPNDEIHRDGAVYVFTYNSVLDEWEQSQKLVPSDREVDEKGMSFGYSLDVDGNYLVVGAQQWYQGANGRSGGAYVFKRQGNTWTEQQILLSPDPQDRDEFGTSVGISANLIVVSAPLENAEEPLPYYDQDWGAAYVFQRNIDQDRWELQQRLEASDPMDADEFGTSVAIDQARTIIGMPRRDQTTQNPDDYFPNAGAVYFFEADATILHLNPTTENFIDLQLSPNPSTDQVLIKWGDAYQLEQVRLLNQQGQVLRHSSRPNAPLQWQLSDLARGLYFIQTQTATHSMLTKLVVH